MTDKQVIGPHILYCADARDIVDQLEFDVLCSDPPYGVNRGSGSINKANKKAIYHANFPDTPEYIENVCSEVIRLSIAKATRGAITPGGKNARFYDFPDAIGGFYQPAGSGMCEWGSVNLQPIFYYGRDPRLGKKIIPLARQLTEHAPKNLHPCPKPVNAWRWLVDKVSLEGEVVLDPFMGTGTTGVCCHALNRKFVGIELDRKYFDYACLQIENAISQPDLFIKNMDTPKEKTRKLI